MREKLRFIAKILLSGSGLAVFVPLWFCLVERLAFDWQMPLFGFLLGVVIGILGGCICGKPSESKDRARY